MALYERQPQDDSPLRVKQRAGARRTAWTLAAIAAFAFVLFILSGVLGH